MSSNPLDFDLNLTCNNHYPAGLPEYKCMSINVCLTRDPGPSKRLCPLGPQRPEGHGVTLRDGRPLPNRLVQSQGGIEVVATTGVADTRSYPVRVVPIFPEHRVFHEDCEIHPRCTDRRCTYCCLSCGRSHRSRARRWRLSRPRPKRPQQRRLRVSR